jgi:hypothetical protein
MMGLFGNLFDEDFDEYPDPHGVQPKEDKSLRQFVKQLFNQTDISDLDGVNRTMRISDSIDTSQTHFTKDSGSDNGGNNQNWFKD